VILAGLRSEDQEETIVNVGTSTIVRITGRAAELDGFIRSFEPLDDIGIVSIRYPENAPGQAGEVYPGTGDQISLELHFGMAPNADSAFELVMEQLRNFQRVQIKVISAQFT
jgi:hypothetical protein